MELYILNKLFQPVAVVDQYSSLIWTKRYWNCGDFELCIPANPDLLQHLQIGYYVQRKDCDCTMIIEKIQIKTDVENGNYFTVSGRSAESILSYRVCINTGWGTNFPHYVCQVLIESAFDLKNSSSKRYVSEIGKITGHSEMIPYIFWTGAYEGQSLMESIYSVCMEFGMGYKFILSNDKFDIYFYFGTDRTIDQHENAPVIFSPEYYNLINSEYEYDTSELKTDICIAGDEGDSQMKVWYPDENSGLSRREQYVDAKSVKRKKDDGSYCNDDEFRSMLIQKGKEEFTKLAVFPIFSGEVDTNFQFIYRRDWDLGDMVTIENEYGVKANARIIEVIETDDENGYKIIPTFSEWEMV